jgi:hypothetical protein
MNIEYISYEEAQKLIPVFEWYASSGQWKELRYDARMLLKELKDVRDVKYTLHGRQMFVTEKQHDLLLEVRGELGI